MLTRTLSLLARDVQIMAAGTFTIVKIIAMKLKNLILFVLNLLKRALHIPASDARKSRPSGRPRRHFQRRLRHTGSR